MDPQGPHDSFDSPPARLADLLDDLVVWFERRRHLMPRAGVVLLTAMVVGAGGWWALRPTSVTSIEDRIPMVALEPSIPGSGTTEPANGGEGSDVGEQLTVHVTGAVAQPGVYEFVGGDRVIDAIDAAGGALGGADLAAVNLAASLVDGSQVRIPIEGEVLLAPLLPVGGVPTDGGAGDDEPVVLNSATASDLERLTGVGPATAEAIITWRTNNGPFIAVEQLMDVPGIGPAKFAAMAAQVVVG